MVAEGSRLKKIPSENQRIIDNKQILNNAQRGNDNKQEVGGLKKFNFLILFL